MNGHLDIERESILSTDAEVLLLSPYSTLVNVCPLRSIMMEVCLFACYVICMIMEASLFACFGIVFCTCMCQPLSVNMFARLQVYVSPLSIVEN